MLAYNLHHVAIAVTDLDEAIERFGALYGVEVEHREVVSEQGVEEAMLPVGGSFVQLLQPLRPDTPVGRFLETRGEGMHHIAIAVADIDAALLHLVDQGARLVDEAPRLGGGGEDRLRSSQGMGGDLVELVEVPA